MRRTTVAKREDMSGTLIASALHKALNRNFPFSVTGRLFNDGPISAALRGQSEDVSCKGFSGPLAVDGRCDTCSLTRGATNNNINWSDILASQLRYVFEDRHVWPVLPKDLAAERVDLAEGDGLEATRPFQSETETANAAEDVQHREHQADLTMLITSSYWTPRNRM